MDNGRSRARRWVIRRAFADRVAGMARKSDLTTTRDELLQLLAPYFPGMEVQVEHSPRWERTCLTFRWAGFAGTLPEERFRRLLLHIPQDYREKKLSGVVWLELAPDESVDEYLALPRSEDVAGREKPIARRLIRSGFFEAMQEHLGPVPVDQCMNDLSITRQVLGDLGLTAGQCRDACLLLILHGAYADCDVLLEARSAILALEKQP